MPREPKVSFFPLSWAMMWEISPNPGRIRIYTSGCPKNQNRCWYRIGSPPLAGSKNEVFRFRSVRSIVIAPARTGSDNRRRRAVIATDQTNRGFRSRVIPFDRMLIVVVIKFAAPRIDEIPSRCTLKIAKSTDAPIWAILDDKGG